MLQREWGLLSLASAILFFLGLSWILTWLLVPKENQRDEYSDIKLSPLSVDRRKEAELKGQRERKLLSVW